MMRSPLWVGTVLALACPGVLAEEDFIPPQPLYQASLVKYWQLQLPLDSGQQVQQAYLVDDHLYLGTQDGYVFALHAPTGVVRWLRPITRSGYPLRRPCHADDRAIFITPVDMQVYDRLSGDPIGRRELRFPAGTAGVSDGIRVFVGGLDRRLYALDVQTQYVDWRVITGGPIGSTPAIHGDLVYVADDAGHVYACTRDRKLFQWQASAYDRITADLVVAEAGVFVASRDFSLYLLDLNFGNLRWQARFSGPLYDPPVVTPELVYQYCPADGLVAVEAAAVGVVGERLRWKLPAGRMALAVHGDQVYVLTRNETIAAVQIKTGDVTHTIPAPGLVLGIPAPALETIYLASPDGRVFCARPRGVPPLQKEDLLAALRPPVTAEQEPATVAPTTQPVAATEDALRTRRQGIPVGGKSRVSRQFTPREQSE
jgi:outer membrane protein assembly factor BamB